MNDTTARTQPISADAGFWDRMARRYAKSSIRDMAGYEHTLARTSALLTSNTSVLELGCGTGTTALRLAEQAPSYLATDLSAEMIAIANEKLTAEPHSSLRFEVATVESLLRKGERHQVVLGFNYLHLVEDLHETLVGIYGLVEPGGRFVSKTPCLREMNPMFRLLIPLMRLIRLAPPSLRWFDEAELLNALQAAGFEIEAAERHGTKGKDVRPFIIARRD